VNILKIKKKTLSM